MSASERSPHSSVEDIPRYITFSHEHVNCVIVHSKYGDNPVVAAQVVPDGTTVSISLPAGGRWRYAGTRIPGREGNGWPYGSCGPEKFRTPLTAEPLLDDYFSSFEVYADDGWDNLVDDVPYTLVRSQLERMIAEGLPVTILPAGQAVSRLGQVVDGWAVNGVNRALGALKLKYAPLPLNLCEPISYRNFFKLALDLYEALSGKEPPAISDENGPLSDGDDYFYKQAGIEGIFDISGVTHFEPDDPLTREQAAVVLVHICLVKPEQFADLDWAGFSEDAPPVRDSCTRKAIAFMAEKGIVEDGSGFDPKSSVRCEEALIMALRVLERLK